MRRDPVVGVRVLVSVALPAPPRVIPVPDRGRQTPPGEHAGRGDPRAVEQLDQSPDLTREDGHRAEVAAAKPRHRAARGRPSRVDLKTEQKLVLLGDMTGPADQPQIRDKLIRRVIQRRVRALGLEQIPAERVRVARQRALDPRDPSQRGVVPGQGGEHAAVLLKALLALVGRQQLKRAALDSHRRRVRAGAPVLGHAEQRAVIRRQLALQQLHVRQLRRPVNRRAYRLGIELSGWEADDVTDLRGLAAKPRAAAAHEKPDHHRGPLLNRLPPNRDDHDTRHQPCNDHREPQPAQAPGPQTRPTPAHPRPPARPAAGREGRG